MLGAVGLFADGLGIYSFFSDDSEDRDNRINSNLNEIRDQLNAVKDGIDELQGLANAQINQDIAQSLGSSQSALTALERYSASDDPDVRATEAAAAIQLSELGLNEIISQTSTVKDVASRDSLVYAFSAIHYAMVTRQAVATVVQDGPLGSAGLHTSIKTAAGFLYNTNDPASSLLFEIEDRLRDDIEAVLSESSGPGPGRVFERPEDVQNGPVTVQVQSTQTDAIETRVVEREFEFVDTGGVFPIPVVEPLENYQTRVENALNALRENVFQQDREAMGLEVLWEIGLRVHDNLGGTGSSLSTQHEFILTSGNDVQDGTDIADYLSGRQGDDQLNGGGGPDALSGGSGNDILRGGTGVDFLAGGPGNDVLFAESSRGEFGTDDVARFAGLSSDYRITGGTEYAVVSGGSGGRDKLFGFSFLRFDDGVFELGEGSALDGAGDPEDFIIAERVALLYEAALDRNGEIDLPGLNFYIDVTERDNLSDEFLAQDLMTSPEFALRFGDVDTLTNDEFLERIYLNVLDRASDEAGRQFYLELLDAGTITRALALADIAVSPENTAESVNVLMDLYEASAGEWSFL